MSFLKDIQCFSRGKLKPTKSRVMLPDGRVIEETRDQSGHVIKSVKISDGFGFVGDLKPDLQVGEILPGLIMGSQDVAADMDLLKKYSVTHILNLASYVQNSFPNHFIYEKLDILDLPETDIRKYFKPCFSFIEEGRKHGCVLVHCNAGISRAASVVIGYLMKTQNMKFNEAFKYVRSKRSVIQPNEGFMDQLKKYEYQKDNQPPSYQL